MQIYDKNPKTSQELQKLTQRKIRVTAWATRILFIRLLFVYQTYFTSSELPSCDWNLITSQWPPNLGPTRFRIPFCWRAFRLYFTPSSVILPTLTTSSDALTDGNDSIILRISCCASVNLRVVVRVVGVAVRVVSCLCSKPEPCFKAEVLADICWSFWLTSRKYKHGVRNCHS